jgi:hypothetical protein
MHALAIVLTLLNTMKRSSPASFEIKTCFDKLTQVDFRLQACSASLYLCFSVFHSLFR